MLKAIIRGGGLKLSEEVQIYSTNIWEGYFALSKMTPPNCNCAQDAAGIGVAEQCRHLPNAVPNLENTPFPRVFMGYGSVP